MAAPLPQPMRKRLPLALALLLHNIAHADARDGATPCSELGTCGANFNALPTNPGFSYDGYVHMDMSHDSVHLDRAPFGNEGSDTRLTSPGATISFSTNAHRVQAIFDYRGSKPCLPDCPRQADGKCYQPTGATCPNQCEILVDIDGVRTQVQHTNLVGQALTHDHKQRDFQGEIKLTLIDQGDSPTYAEHMYTLTLPWGAPVSLRRVHLEHPTGVDTMPSFTSPLSDGAAHAHKPKLVAFGDAITMGWCATTGYPQRLAALNGWAALNLGLVGEGVQPSHGAAIGQQNADVVVLMLGASVWDACNAPDVSQSYRELVANIRSTMADRHTPIVAVTPTLSWREAKACPGPANVIPPDTRRQIASAVEAMKAAGDASLFLVDGTLLVPPTYLVDGLHPGEQGMVELAHNLNANMGFGSLVFEVVRCPTLTIAIRGAAPHAPVDVYWGEPAQTASVISAEGGAHCPGRSLMISPLGMVMATADADGTVVVPVEAVNGFDTCHSMVFQIIDGASCTNSRVGHVSTTYSSRRGTPAEKWTKLNAAAAGANLASKWSLRPPPPPALSWPPLWPAAHSHEESSAPTHSQPQPPQDGSLSARDAPAAVGDASGADALKTTQQPKHAHIHPPHPPHPPPPPPPPPPSPPTAEEPQHAKPAVPKPAATKPKPVSGGSDPASHAAHPNAAGPPIGTAQAAGAAGAAHTKAAGSTHASSTPSASRASGLYAFTVGVLTDESARGRGDSMRLISVSFAGMLTGMIALGVAGGLLVGRVAYRRAARSMRAHAGVRAHADDDEEEAKELMPARFLVDGSEELVVAVDLDGCRSVATLKKALCAAYADVTGDELLPATMAVEYEDEADGFCRLDAQNNHPIIDGRLRSSHSLLITARAIGRRS